jgi:DNA-binding response OmpR family regulator
MAMGSESPDAEPTRRLRVGDWVVDPALNQLSRGSEVERLEPKAIEVLMGLARHAGQVVSGDKLLSESVGDCAFGARTFVLVVRSGKPAGHALHAAA